MRGKPIDWSQAVTIGGVVTTLHDWLAENWQSISDADVAAWLSENGLGPVSRNAIRNKRHREGWLKGQGQGWTGEKEKLDPGGLPLIVIVPAENEKIEIVRPKPFTGDDVLRAIKNRPLTLRQLSRVFDRSEETIAAVLEALRAEHYNIVMSQDRAELDTRTVIAPDVQVPYLADLVGMWVKYGVVSDSHGGSTAQQITNLSRFVDQAYDEGVRVFLHAGDLFAGEDVYRGQKRDLFAQGADPQVVVVSETLPQRPGVHWYVIGGNHDYSFVKASGHNVVEALAAKREDVTYLGFDVADVPITDRVEVRLFHPSGGVPYAISYRMQKAIEQIAFDELTRAIETQENPKVRQVVAGHLHVAMDLPRRPIIGMQAGCWEGRTNYLKRKGLYPEIGGWIVEMFIDDAGLIRRYRTEFIPFVEVERDYLNYPDLIMKVQVGYQLPEIEAVFEWRPEGNGTDGE